VPDPTDHHPSIGALTTREVPESLAECRQLIDEVDALLAVLLEYRATISARVQQLKPVGGHAGRDLRREAEIVQRMAQWAPRLGPRRLRRIMTAVIEESLDLAEEAGSAAR
jgi:chorismate mutase